MYNFAVFNNNLSVSTLYHSVNDNAFIVVIEAVDWYSSQIKDARALDKILNKAFRLIDINVSISEIPLEFARNIDFVLREQNKQGADNKGLSFTSVSLTKNMVFVCTAGYTRVHLLQNKKLIGITRDHNLVNDNDENISFGDLDVKFENCSPLFFAQTRALGVENSNKPPELVTWEVTGNYSILLCSDKFHKFRNYSEYIESYAGGINFNSDNEDEHTKGIIAKVEYINNSINY
jgi:serine/threonine protein phosphatase PrpC